MYFEERESDMRKKQHLWALLISILASICLLVALFLYAFNLPENKPKAMALTAVSLPKMPETSDNAQVLELQIANQLLQLKTDSLMQLKTQKAVIAPEKSNNEAEKKAYKKQLAQVDSLRKIENQKIAELNAQLEEAKKMAVKQALAHQPKKNKAQLALEKKQADELAKKEALNKKEIEKKSPKLLAEIPKKLLKSKCKNSGEVQLNVTFDSKGRFISASRAGGSKDKCLVDQARDLVKKQLKTEPSQRSHSLKYSVNFH